MSEINAIRLEIRKYFQINGYSLKEDGLKTLVNVFVNLDAEERSEWLEKLIDTLQKQPLSTPIIGKDDIAKVIKECSDLESKETDILVVINAFTVPRFTYNIERKKFELDTKVPTSLYSIPDEKWRLFYERYQLILQRTKRHRIFNTVNHLSSEKTFSLKPVEYFLGSSGSHSGILILGMLSQFSHRKFVIEDPSGHLPIDLSNTTFKDGLFTECSMVLAEGSYEDGTFIATAIGFPPSEEASTSILHYGNVNYFGGPSDIIARNSEKVRFLEEKTPDSMIVFLSDVWIDQIKVMEKLKTLFAGYSEMPPTAFVLIGNFVSCYKGKAVFKTLKECFKNLAKILTEFSELVQKSKFIFVPGPNDPGLTTILPRPPISNFVTEDFAKQIPNAIFTTNPCRIQYGTQEIVVFREDLMSKFCRNSINSPWQSNKEVDIPNLCVKTLVSNAHLCPLPLNASPVYWAFDHALRLYPLPDLVVIGDKCEPFQVNNTGCNFINPGSFPRTNFSFKVYMPASKTVEDSQICDS